MSRVRSFSDLMDRIQRHFHQTAVIIEPFHCLLGNSDLINGCTDVEDWPRPLLSPDHRFCPDLTFPVGPQCHLEGLWSRFLARPLEKRILCCLFVGIFRLTHGDLAYSVSEILL